MRRLRWTQSTAASRAAHSLFHRGWTQSTALVATRLKPSLRKLPSGGGSSILFDVLLLRWRSSVVPRGTRRPLVWRWRASAGLGPPQGPSGAALNRLSARVGCASHRPGQQQQRLVGVATAAAAVTGRCGSCAAAICARWLRRLGAQRPRCLRGTADSVGAIGGSIAPRRAGRPAAREGSSNRGSRKFAGNRRERGCERPVGVEVVAGGALNCTWRPQGGRAASPRPRDTQAALSRHPAGAKKVVYSGFARERLNWS